MIILELTAFLIGIIFLSISFSGIGSLFTLDMKSDFLTNPTIDYNIDYT